MDVTRWLSLIALAPGVGRISPGANAASLASDCPSVSNTMLSHSE